MKVVEASVDDRHSCTAEIEQEMLLFGVKTDLAGLCELKAQCVTFTGLYWQKME